MTLTRRTYTPEFRLKAARLVVDDLRPAATVAVELDIPVKTLRQWVRKYRDHTLQKLSNGPTHQQAEIARL